MVGDELNTKEYLMWKALSLKDIEEHLPFLRDVCYRVEAKIILELGTRFGNSTLAFLQAAQVLGAKVISIDIEDCSKAGFGYPNWEYHQMNDLDFEINEDIDVLFIDTSHTFGQTLAELDKFAPKVKNGGVILLHDTIATPDVYAAIKYYLSHNPQYKFEHRTNCCGLGVLWKQV